MTDLEPFVDLLREEGMEKVCHYGRTLLDHCVTTSDRALDWDLGRDVAVACLFHSFYLVVATPMIHTRHSLARAIGEDSEAIVYGYTRKIPLAGSLASGVAQVEAANLADLASYVPLTPEQRQYLMRHASICLPHLPLRASHDLRNLLECGAACS